MKTLTMKTLTRNTAAKKLGVKDTNLIYWERLGKLKPKKIRIGDSSLVIYTPDLVEKARKILSRHTRRKKVMKMRGYFNLTVGDRKLGVLVCDSKYWRTYRRANSVFKKELANRSLKEELLNLLKTYPRYKEKFLKGESIQV